MEQEKKMQNNKMIHAVTCILALLALLAAQAQNALAKAAVTPEEARAIAKEAYI